MLPWFSLTVLIKYYWLFAPFFLLFSGEVSLITFSILASRFASINLYILLINAVLMAFVSEQLLFVLPRKKKEINKYENHWLFKEIVQQNLIFGTVVFFIGRFFPVLRIIIPVALSYSSMSLLYFSCLNLLVSLTWCGSLVYIGSLIGKKTLHLQLENILQSLEYQYHYYHKFLLKTSLVCLGLLILWIGYRFYTQNSKNQ